MLNHHTGVTQMVICLGDLPYKESGVILPSAVKKYGWLREDVL